MTDRSNEYAFLDARTLPGGGPTVDEHYGPAWQIVGPTGDHSPVVIVPDPGDGSAKPLADRILLLLIMDSRQ